MTNPMTREEIIRLFRDNSYGIEQLMNEDQYRINTKSISFEYEGKPKTVENISFLGFTKDKVWFNDDGFIIDKISEAPFGFSTEPSETIHPMVTAFYKMKKVINLFGGEV